MDITDKKLQNFALTGRAKLGYDWIDQGVENLLDAGCSYGYATHHFATKAQRTVGLEPIEKYYKLAKQNHPKLEFVHSFLEEAPFGDQEFDCALLLDVLEHVQDEAQSLNQLHRVLKPGGSLIISTPHKGLFGFMDRVNYEYYFRKYMPTFYRYTYRLFKGKFPQDQSMLGYESFHRHYSLNDFKRLLDQANFAGEYEIEKVHRSGLFLMPLAGNVKLVADLVLPKRLARWIYQPFKWLSLLEFKIPFGPLAYNIAIKVRKLA